MSTMEKQATFQLHTVHLANIDLGQRRRDDYGDINAMARSIERVGLLHPITIDRVNGGYLLVAGARRIKALQMLGITETSARLKENLTPHELREIEWEENEQRKPWSEQERGKTFQAAERLMKDAERVQAILQEEAAEKTGDVDLGDSPKTKRTRADSAKKTVTQAQVADAVGVSRRELNKAESHVALATQFPYMKSWRQSHVLAIKEALDDLPKAERDDAAAVLQCAKVLDPAKAIDLLKNICVKKPAERKEIYTLAHSDDKRERSLALTRAAELPPMPDPRLPCVERAIHDLRQAVKDFPKDPLTPVIGSLIKELRKVLNQIKDVSFDARRKTPVGRVQ
jgi:ParB family chromosome partitioning protein